MKKQKLIQLSTDFVEAATFGKINLRKRRVRSTIKKHVKNNSKLLELFEYKTPRKIKPELLKIGNLNKEVLICFGTTEEFKEYIKRYFGEEKETSWRVFAVTAKFNRKNPTTDMYGYQINSRSGRLSTDLILIDHKSDDIFYCDTRMFNWKQKVQATL